MRRRAGVRDPPLNNRQPIPPIAQHSRGRVDPTGARPRFRISAAHSSENGRRSPRGPVNSVGYLRVVFAVDDIDVTLAQLREHGAQLVSDKGVQYDGSIRSATFAVLKVFS